MWFMGGRVGHQFSQATVRIYIKSHFSTKKVIIIAMTRMLSFPGYIVTLNLRREYMVFLSLYKRFVCKKKQFTIVVISWQNKICSKLNLLNNTSNINTQVHVREKINIKVSCKEHLLNLVNTVVQYYLSNDGVPLYYCACSSECTS